METILLLQITAHILADFFFQLENWCSSKQKKGFRSLKMYYHIGIVFLVSALMAFSLSFIPYALIIALSHLLIDLLKSYIERTFSKKKNSSLSQGQIYGNPYIFILDQLLHLIIIYVSVCLFANCNALPSYLENINIDYVLIILCFLLCLKPANVLIRILLSSLNLFEIESKTDIPESGKEDLKRAGRWIGSIERTLAFILVLLGQFTAIGFIIAAKSILRYNDKSLGKTEYVLIGTLMSFGIAIVLGLGITQRVFTQLLDWIS